MLPQRSLQQENKLWLSWHDSAWIPILNPTNIMDYFSQKSNPFYDRTCNNETIMMQRMPLEHLKNMSGVEYILLHVHEPILYVVRKQYRQDMNNVTPMADYYIIAGIVYQAPDLASVFNSRILSAVTHLQTAFEEVNQYSRYHPNKGYSWDFSSNKALSDKSKNQNKKDSTTREEIGSLFQRQRVDMLLGELLRKFPPPMPQMPPPNQQQASNQNPQSQQQQQVKTEIQPDSQQIVIKTEPGEQPKVNSTLTGGSASLVPKVEPNADMPPPEKKMKFY